MDEHAFDRLARSLSGASSRRRLLGSVLGGVTAVLAGAAAIQAQGRGQGLALGVGKDKGRPAEVGTAGEHGGGAAKGTDVDGPEELDVDEVEEADEVEKIEVGKGTEKVAICHRGKVITVGAPALTTHQEKHGDATCTTGTSGSECTVYAKGGTCTVNTEGAACQCADGITPEAEAVDAALEEEDVAEAQRATPRGRQSSRRAKRRARLEARRLEKRAR